MVPRPGLTGKARATASALWIAAARARESARPDRLFDDPWAAALAGDTGRRALAASERASGRENAYIPVRTRFFDDLLLAAAGWARQVVLLGAGMDTRAYRLALPPDLIVYEVDHGSQFDNKEQVLAGVAPRTGRRTVAADLRYDWPAALVGAGFTSGAPTVWLAEGLFFYLESGQVEAILRSAAAASEHRALFAADLFGTGLLELRRARGQIEGPDPFCTDEPEDLFARTGWPDVTLVQPGHPAANYGRLPDVPADLHASGTYLVSATKQVG